MFPNEKSADYKSAQPPPTHIPPPPNTIQVLWEYGERGRYGNKQIWRTSHDPGCFVSGEFETSAGKSWKKAVHEGWELGRVVYSICSQSRSAAGKEQRAPGANKGSIFQ